MIADPGGTDPRLLKFTPDKFSGVDEDWQEWKDDFMGYMGLFNRKFYEVLEPLKKESVFPEMSALDALGKQQNLTVYFLLKSFLKKGKAKTIVKGIKDRNGGKAWVELLKEYDQEEAVDNLGSLGSLMDFDSGELWEMSERLTKFENELDEYENHSKEKVSDNFKKAVLQKKAPSVIRDHLALHISEYDTYNQVKKVIKQYLKAKKTDIEKARKESEKRNPKKKDKDSDDMDVSWIHWKGDRKGKGGKDKGKDKGKYKGKDSWGKQSWGKNDGWYQNNYYQKDGKGKGKGQGGGYGGYGGYAKSWSQGSPKGWGAKNTGGGECYNCGWLGHKAKDCKWPAKKQPPATPMDVSNVQKADAAKNDGDGKGVDTKQVTLIIPPPPESSEWELDYVMHIGQLKEIPGYRGGPTTILPMEDPEPALDPVPKLDFATLFKFWEQREDDGRVQVSDIQSAYLRTSLKTKPVLSEEPESDAEWVLEADQNEAAKECMVNVENNTMEVFRIMNEHYDWKCVTAENTEEAFDAKYDRKEIQVTKLVARMFSLDPPKSPDEIMTLSSGSSLEEMSEETDAVKDEVDELTEVFEEDHFERGVNAVTPREEEVLLDSGSVGHCAPLWFANQSALKKTPSQGLCSASGARLQHHGERNVKFEMSGDDKVARASATFQVLDVKRPLFSVAELCDKGFYLIFMDSGGWLIRKDDKKKKVWFKRRGKLYYLNVTLRELDSMTNQDVSPIEDLDINKTEIPELVEEAEREAQDPKLKATPVLPHPEVVARHNATHLPYQSWCVHCVRGKAKDDPHFRTDPEKKGHKDRPEALTTVQLDYMFLKERKGSEEKKLTIFTGYVVRSGRGFSAQVFSKGTAAQYPQKLLEGFLRDNGLSAGANLRFDPENAVTFVVISCHMDDPLGVGPPGKVQSTFLELSKHVLLKIGPVLKENEVLEHIGRSYRKLPGGGFRIEPGESYFRETLELFGMANCHGVGSPGSPTKSPEEKAADEVEADSGTQYLLRQGVGRLQFKVEDRNDIAYALKEVARELSKLSMGTFLRFKRILRYLKECDQVGLVIKMPRLPKRIKIYVDSNWAGCGRTAKSTSSIWVEWGPFAPLRSACKTQGLIALSSGEAEYYAQLLGASEGLFIRNLLSELNHEVDLEICNDSSAARGICSRQGPGSQKHFNIKYLWLQDLVKKEEVKLSVVRGDKNKSDLGTKYFHPTDLKSRKELCGFEAIEDKEVNMIYADGLDETNKEEAKLGKHCAHCWDLGGDSVGPEEIREVNMICHSQGASSEGAQFGVRSSTGVLSKLLLTLVFCDAVVQNEAWSDDVSLVVPGDTLNQISQTVDLVLEDLRWKIMLLVMLAIIARVIFLCGEKILVELAVDRIRDAVSWLWKGGRRGRAAEVQVDLEVPDIEKAERGIQTDEGWLDREVEIIEIPADPVPAICPHVFLPMRTNVLGVHTDGNLKVHYYAECDRYQARVPGRRGSSRDICVNCISRFREENNTEFRNAFFRQNT